MNFTGSVNATDLKTQIQNWETVLTKYRETTAKADLESVAKDLDSVLSDLDKDFKNFQDNEQKNTKGDPSDLTNFVAYGVEKLKWKDGAGERDDLSTHVPDKGGLNDGGISEKFNEKMSGDAKAIQKLVQDGPGERVQAAAEECAVALNVADPSGSHNYCEAYKKVGHKVDLVKTLVGLCNYETEELKKEPKSIQAFCKSDAVPAIAASERAKRNKAPEMSAFDFLTEKNKFLTFSGSTGVDISWNVADTRGSAAHVGTQGSFKTVGHIDGGFGFKLGRRLAGYAYPANGPVHAVSKKLLEVTPEALEKRRRLDVKTYLAKVGKDLKDGIEAGKDINQGAFLGNPCRRRLQLGIQGCLSFGHAVTRDYSVSMSRSATRNNGRSHAVAISLRDGNLQDSFVVHVAQDPVYGTPIFRTIGGRSTCPGETGTTKRDSHVTIQEIRPLCQKSNELCKGPFECECKDLAPGQDAFFSVVVQNRSPWVVPVKYLLRAVNGVPTAWYSKKYDDAAKESCPEGDAGSLEIRAMGFVGGRSDMRDAAHDGIILQPLPYGQTEVRIRVTRPNLAPQCFSYKNIKLELQCDCENTDWDGREDVYQYRTSEMDPVTGSFHVTHPVYDSTTYGFKEDTKAWGPDTSTKTFDVSWSNEQGCTYADASNYDNNAKQDDGSCVFESPGCIYAAAVNYDPLATVNDGSCIFTSQEPTRILGCLYKAANNWNPVATVDDGSCEFNSRGCTYAAAENYDRTATTDDGTCIFGGEISARHVRGGFCVDGVVSSDSLDLKEVLMKGIAQFVGLAVAAIDLDISLSTACRDGTRRHVRRRLQGTSSQITFSIVASPSDTEDVVNALEGLTPEVIDEWLKSLGASATSIDKPQVTVTTQAPTAQPSPEPSSEPSPTPSAVPTASSAPSSAPSPRPSAAPTGSAAPTVSAPPTSTPTHVPSPAPSPGPTREPTSEPTAKPVPEPTTTLSPTRSETYAPTTDTYAPTSTSP